MPRKKTAPSSTLALADVLRSMIRHELEAMASPKAPKAKPAKAKAKKAKAKKAKAQPYSTPKKKGPTWGGKGKKPMGRKPTPLDPALVRSLWARLPTTKETAIGRAAFGVPIKLEILETIITRALAKNLLRKQGTARWTTYWAKVPASAALGKLCPEASTGEIVAWDQPASPAPEVPAVLAEPAMPTPAAPPVEA